jgi:hypothetical protein
MAQSDVAGQEILLYSEPGVRFGDIPFAQVDGAFWDISFRPVGERPSRSSASP